MGGGVFCSGNYLEYFQVVCIVGQARKKSMNDWRGFANCSLGGLPFPQPNQSTFCGTGAMGKKK